MALQRQAPNAIVTSSAHSGECRVGLNPLIVAQWKREILIPASTSQT
jgi:hypothetical protein